MDRIYDKYLKELADQGRLSIGIDRNDEGEYLMMIDTTFRDAEELLDFYRRKIGDLLKIEGLSVYGNSDEAVRVATKRNSRGVALPLDEADEEAKWAVDVSKILRDMKGIEENEIYNNTIDHLGARTLQAVSVSNILEGERPEYSFYSDIVEQLRPKGPIEIDVYEEKSEEKEVDVEQELEEKRLEAEEQDKDFEIDYDKIVSSTISESKRRIKEVEDQLDEEDWKALLEAEKHGKDRATFKPYLEDRLEEEREDT